MRKNTGFGVAGIILIIVAITAIGLIGWRLYDASNNKQSGSTTQTNSNHTDEPRSTNAEQEDNTKITEWQVKIPDTASGEKISYKMDSSQQFAYVTTDKLDRLASTHADCSEANKSVSISRSKPGDDHFGTPWKEGELAEIGIKIDDYYYYKTLGQPCFPGQGFVMPAEISTIRKELSDAIKQIKPM